MECALYVAIQMRVENGDFIKVIEGIVLAVRNSFCFHDVCFMGSHLKRHKVWDIVGLLLTDVNHVLSIAFKNISPLCESKVLMAL
jgi:hypothetical protein